MNPLLKCMIILGWLLLPLAPIDAQWQSLGPGGSSTNMFAGTDDMVYAATNSGVYETADHGDHWSLIGLGQFKALALHTAGNVLFVACSGGEIFSTSDHGRTWERADAGLPPAVQTTFASIGDVVFVNRITTAYNGTGWTNQGVFRSADNGKSWEQVGAQAFAPDVGVWLASDVDTLYAFSAINGKLFKSYDLGNTWEWFSIDPAGLAGIIPPLAISNSILYAHTANSFQRSFDHGKTWVPIFTFPPGGVTTLSLTAHDGVVLAGTYRHGVLSSTDSGTTWQNSGFASIPVQATFIADSYWLIGTAQRGIYRSRDLGLHWEGVNNGFTNAYVVSLVQHKDVLFAITKIGLSSSVDQGVTWRDHTLDFMPVSLASVYGDLFAGAADGIHVSHDLGMHWSLLDSTMKSATTIAEGAGILYVCLGRNNIYASADSGRTWSPLLSIPPNYKFNSFTVYDNLAFAASTGLGEDAAYGRLYYSTDRGMHWPSSGISSYSPVLSAGMTSLGLYAGINDSRNWPKQSGIVRSLDTAATWEYVGSPVQSLLMTSILETTAGVFIGTSNQGVFNVSADGSQLLPVFPPVQSGLSNITSMASSSEYLFVGTPGYGVWRVPFTLLGVEEGPGPAETQPMEFALYQNYPNPFNPTTTISFTTPSRSHVSLKIFDVVGREVATIVSEELPAGEYSRHWNASAMPSGMYFYRLQAGSFTETKKLLIVR